MSPRSPYRWPPGEGGPGRQRHRSASSPQNHRLPLGKKSMKRRTDVNWLPYHYTHRRAVSDCWQTSRCCLPKTIVLGHPTCIPTGGKFQVQWFLSLCLTRTHNINRRRGCGGNKVTNCWCHQSRVQGPRLPRGNKRVPSHQQQSSYPKPQYSPPVSREYRRVRDGGLQASWAGRAPGESQGRGDPFTSRASCG